VHEHVFLGEHHSRNERRVQIVVGLTLLMMVGEIVAGTIYGSMALLADGWHMATHAGALSVSAAAYIFARRRARDSRFVFGTGKIGDLAGYTSAIALAGAALFVGYESVERLLNPTAIRFDEAIFVAVLGLAVNLASAVLLHQGAQGHDHGHEHDHEHEHEGHDHEDHNLRSAHLHVLADALTSVFAIVALFAGKYLQWMWMDAVCGLVGAVVILRWSIGLLRDTGAVLLDVESDPRLSARIRELIEQENGAHITDLHVWCVGPGNFSAIVSIASDQPREPQHYKSLLRGVAGLAHLTVEVQPLAALRD
jgi:cation diffusion facilitator family transporter